MTSHKICWHLIAMVTESTRTPVDAVSWHWTLLKALGLSPCSKGAINWPIRGELRRLPRRPPRNRTRVASTEGQMHAPVPTIPKAHCGHFRNVSISGNICKKGNVNVSIFGNISKNGKVSSQKMMNKKSSFCKIYLPDYWCFNMIA